MDGGVSPQAISSYRGVYVAMWRPAWGLSAQQTFDHKVYWPGDLQRATVERLIKVIVEPSLLGLKVPPLCPVRVGSETSLPCGITLMVHADMQSSATCVG